MNDNARPNNVGTGAVMIVPGGHVHDSASPEPETIGTQVRRRREDSRRLPRMGDGRRDPLEPLPDVEPAGVGELDAWARALAHLQSVGLVGLPPTHVRRSLAAFPERYRDVLPRRSAA